MYRGMNALGSGHWLVGTRKDSFSAAASTNPKKTSASTETISVHSQRLKWPILSLPQLKMNLIEENGSQIKSWCGDRKVADFYLNCDEKESCSDDEFIESALKGIKTKNEKEELLDQKNIDKEFDYDPTELCAIKKEINDVNELTAEELSDYNCESRIKSEFIEQEELHIKDEDDNEDMLKNEKNHNSQSPFIQPKAVHQEEVRVKSKKGEKKKKRKPGNQSVLHQCPQCPYKTSNKQNFKSHSVKHKNPDEIDWYICHECSYKTFRKGDLKIHSKVHNSLMLKCSKCSYETLRSSSLKNHQIKHMTNIDWLYCPKCSFKTNIPSRLRCHVLSHESDAFKCSKCSYQPKTKQQLTLHQAKHEPLEKWHFCPSCPFKTYFKRNLEAHCLRRCHSIYPNSSKQIFKCTQCSFESWYEPILKKHQLIHDQNNWHKCSDCAYKTPYKGDFTKHRVRHQGENAEGWYRCLNCPYKTTRKDNLVTHVTTHNSAIQIRRFECSKCNFKTAYKSSLRQHQLLMHKKAQEIQWFFCYECSFKTKYKSYLPKHIMSKHQKQDYL